MNNIPEYVSYQIVVIKDVVESLYNELKEDVKKSLYLKYRANKNLNINIMRIRERNIGKKNDTLNITQCCKLHIIKQLMNSVYNCYLSDLTLRELAYLLDVNYNKVCAIENTAIEVIKSQQVLMGLGNKVTDILEYREEMKEDMGLLSFL